MAFLAEERFDAGLVPVHTYLMVHVWKAGGNGWMTRSNWVCRCGAKAPRQEQRREGATWNLCGGGVAV